MAGLQLRGAVGGSTGNGGMMPTAAGTPTGPRGGSSTTAAYGIGTSGQAGAMTAALGTGIAGTAAAVILLWLWWSLPR